MHHKSLALSIKTTGLDPGEFIGYASTFGNIDHDGDRVMPGAFTKSISDDSTIPILWEHVHADPRMQVGEVKSARETAQGLEIHARLDVDTEFGAAAYRSIKSRRVKSLSIGYSIRKSAKAADGANELVDLDLVEVSLVARPANGSAIITAVKSVGIPTIKHKSDLARARAADILKEKDTMQKDSFRIRHYTKGRDEQLELIATIIDTADQLGRDLTADEATAIDDATKAADGYRQMIAKARADEKVLADARALADEIGSPISGGASDGRPADDTMTAKSGYLGLTGKAAQSAASQFAGRTGTKALTAAGQQTISVPMLAEIQETGRPPQSILDVLPARIVAAQYAYMRQSVRDLKAAPVAQGATKPTSEMSLETIEQALTVIAHLSEPIPQYVLADNTAIERFVADELIYGLRRAVETQFVAGTGIAPQMTGLTTASGLQIQAFSASPLESIRKAITKLEGVGYSPDVLIISAADWETVELSMAADTAVAFRGLPADAVARRLWGVQAVISTSLPAKTAFILDRTALSLDSDGQIDVRWSDTTGDDFAKNQVRARVEGRFNWSLFKPTGVVKIGTAA